MATRTERKLLARSWSGLSDRQLAIVLVAPAAVLLLVFSVYPFLQALRDSFYSISAVSRAERFTGLHNYARLAQDAEVRAAFVRSGIWIVSNVVVQTTLGLAIALLLNARLRGQTLARGFIIFPYMAPAIVVAAVFRFAFNDFTGIVNYLWLKVPGVDQPIYFLSKPRIALFTVMAVNSWKYTPFMIIVLLARLQTVPTELAEAARMDGANAWQVFRYVTFQWLRPVLLIAVLLRTIWTANDFDVIYLLAFGGPLKATTTVPVEIRDLAYGQQDVGLASALAVLVALLLSVASFIFLRLYHRSEAHLQ